MKLGPLLYVVSTINLQQPSACVLLSSPHSAPAWAEIIVMIILELGLKAEFQASNFSQLRLLHLMVEY